MRKKTTQLLKLTHQLLLLLSITFSDSLSFSDTPVRSRSSAKKVVWFRNHGLRIRDNEALYRAVEDAAVGNVGHSILPVYLWNQQQQTNDDDKKRSNDINDDIHLADYGGGTASEVFIANTLHHLNHTSLHGSLTAGLCTTATTPKHIVNELTSICSQMEATEVYYLEPAVPSSATFEDDLRTLLLEQGITPYSYRSGCSLLDYNKNPPPWKDIVLEHPWRSPLIPFVDYILRELDWQPPAAPLPEPCNLEQLLDMNNKEVRFSKPLFIEDVLRCIGKSGGGTEWGESIAKLWPASEEDAAEALRAFLTSIKDENDVEDEKNYAEDTDDAEINTTEKRTHLASKLSPYLARGVLTSRQVYHAMAELRDQSNYASFVRRICWRDYTVAVASLFPDVIGESRAIRDGYNSSYDASLDEDELKLLKKWKDGATGFPLIDAGMRQLVVEGWMPQKVRLAVSSFLVEGMGISWKAGMQHFEEYLVDFDASINANMWMNAGCVGFDPVSL